MHETTAPLTPQEQLHGFETQRNSTVPRALGELVVGGMVTDSSDGSTLPIASQETETVAEQLKQRIETAIATCEFEPTSELVSAVDGFYRDHHRLQDVIRQVATGGLSETERQKILDGDTKTGNFAIDGTLKSMAQYSGVDARSRQHQLQAADDAISHTYLKEVCVGATTLEDEDYATIGELHAAVRTAAERENLIGNYDDGRMFWRDFGTESADNLAVGRVRGSLEDPRLVPEKIEQRKAFADIVYKDMRHAGQLLFHNTPYLQDVVINPGGEGSFKLTSRSNQYKQTGDYKAGSNKDPLEFAQHTNLTHWCELYMPWAYKIPQSGEDGAKPGTIAVPIAEVIKVAPYSGRDIQYGTLEVKPAAARSLTEKVPVYEGVLFEENRGMSDAPGLTGYDRVFLAGYKDEEQVPAHDYTLDFGQGMKTPRGNVSSILMTEDDQDHHRLSHPFGLGEGYPRTVHLAYRNGLKAPGYDAQTSEKFEAVLTQQKAELKRQIREMQQQSRELPQYVDKYVVPLRGGVMEFKVEGMTEYSQKARKAKNTAGILAA